jgi:two-component system chemotaxis sensor kinase CheA
MDLHQKLLAIFRTEHAEHVQEIRSIMGLLENVQGARARPELTEAFRHAHSLKGAARAVDLQPIEGLAHRIESLLARVREGSLCLDRRAVSVIYQALNCSEDCMASPSAQESPPGWSESVRAIDDLLGVPAEIPGPADEPERAPLEISSPSAEPLRGLVQAGETVRVSVESLNRLLRSSGLIIAEMPRQEEIARRLFEAGRRAEEDSRRPERDPEPSLKAWGGPGATAAERRSTLQEKVRLLAIEIKAIATVQSQSAWALRNRADQLQEDVMEARVVPMEGLFEGFRKMVRDLARDLGKSIQFRVTGAEIRADRLVLQALKDPIMHLLRNAVDHGIETPRERVAKAKAPEGLIAVHVALEKRRLTISVADDGRGVDLEAVAAVAVQKGVLAGEEAARRSSEDLSRLILRPGFSTAAEVTDLSGRGMGLSVVEDTVRRLQGDVCVKPGWGTGAEIVLSVPLSVAATHLLRVSCHGRDFDIPTHCIAGLHRIPPKQLEKALGQSSMRVGGRTVPLCSLAGLLGLPGSDAPSRGILAVVTLKSGERSAAVAVDSFCGVHLALVQELGLPGLPPYIAGGVVRDNGAVSVVLNPAALVEMCRRPEAQQLNAVRPSREAPPASILVVDDSVTTRSLERGILESFGYRVRVAVDGLQALEMLRDAPADLVLADVEMPRMDGFGLLEAVKADAGLRRIPVVLVTSREEGANRRRGLELGAGAYIVKRKFDQRELLRTIQELL